MRLDGGELRRVQWSESEGDSAMAKKAKKQVGLNMRAALYDDLAKLAKDNGQTTTYVLEQAVEHYIQFIAPTQGVVRPEIMAHVRRSVDKNRKLLQLLAK
jgi:predicted DNA-binding protein